MSIKTPVLNVSVDGKPFEIFMSFALLNRCCYIMGENAHIPLILVDPEIREAILREVMALRDPKGKIESYRDLGEYEMSQDDYLNVLEFVAEHVADFTVAATERSARLLGKTQSRVDQIGKQTVKLSASTASPTGQAG